MRTIEVKDLSNSYRVTVNNPKKSLMEFGFDPTLESADLFLLLEDKNIPPTSWIIDDYERVSGKSVRIPYTTYIKNVKNIICDHGFLKDCPYCVYGTE